MTAVSIDGVQNANILYLLSPLVLCKNPMKDCNKKINDEIHNFSSKSDLSCRQIEYARLEQS